MLVPADPCPSETQAPAVALDPGDECRDDRVGGRAMQCPRAELFGVAFDLVGRGGLQLAVVLDADVLQQVELRLDEVDVAFLVRSSSSKRSMDT